MYKRFAALFAGLTRAYGTFKIEQSQSEGKVKGFAETKNEDVTEQLYIDHIQGTKSLGIIPVDEKGEVTFAEIDIDDYNLDIKHLAKRLRDTPFVVLRTKSGGAHVSVFFNAAVDARKVRKKLNQVASTLGHKGCEIFPKQNKIEEGQIGNWINLPYFEAEYTTRYAISPEGVAYSLEEFLDVAEKKKTDLDSFLKIELMKGEFADAPPCLEALTANGFPQGSMNNALFNMGVYAKKKFPEGYEKVVREYNERFMGPGSPKEVANILGSLTKQTYMYLCEQAPINQYCNKRVCLTRKHGVGASSEDLDLGFEIKAVECLEAGSNLWRIDLVRGGENYTMELETEDLTTQPRFRNMCVDTFRYFPPMLKANDWNKFVNGITDMAIRVKAPKDAHPDSQLLTLVEKFCLERGLGKDREGLLMGNPWHDADRTYFRSADLLQYMQSNAIKVKKHKMFQLLRSEYDLKHSQMNVKGKNFNAWSIESFLDQEVPLDLPSMTDEDIAKF